MRSSRSVRTGGSGRRATTCSGRGSRALTQTRLDPGEAAGPARRRARARRARGRARRRPRRHVPPSERRGRRPPAWSTSSGSCWPRWRSSWPRASAPGRGSRPTRWATSRGLRDPRAGGPACWRCGGARCATPASRPSARSRGRRRGPDRRIRGRPRPGRPPGPPRGRRSRSRPRGAAASRASARTRGVEARLLSVTRVAPGAGAAAAPRRAGVHGARRRQRLGGRRAPGAGAAGRRPDHGAAGAGPAHPRLGSRVPRRRPLDVAGHGLCCARTPRRCRDLVALFKSSKMTSARPGARARPARRHGQPEAQAVLRELLGHAEARGLGQLRALRPAALAGGGAHPGDGGLPAHQGRAGGRRQHLAAAHALGSAIGRRSRAEGGEVDERWGRRCCARGWPRRARPGRRRTGWGRWATRGWPGARTLLAGYASGRRRGRARRRRRRAAQDPDAGFREGPAGARGRRRSVVQDRALHTLTRLPARPGPPRRAPRAGGRGPAGTGQLSACS